jgi:PAS domain S-box-containing protein
MFEKARDTKSLIQIPAHPPGDPEGHMTSSDWALDPILNDEGEIDFFVLASLEVSGNIRAEGAEQESEILFKQAARLAHLGHWVWDEDEDRLTEISNEYARIFGLPADEILSRYATRIQENEAIHSDDRERYWGVIAESERNVKAYDTEYRLIRPSGELRYVREVGEPVVDKEGKFVKTVGTLQDITEIKQAGLEILAAKEEAEFANNAKSEFLARMSHELRTPLNAVLGFGQLLELDKDTLTEEQNEGVSHIIAGGKHLLQLIDEVLDIARVDSGNLDISMEAVSLDQASGEALLLINPLAAKHKITLGERSNKDFHVLADERRLKQVLVNLLSNAVKYNRAGGMVEVSYDAIEDGLIRIAVSDTGIGIRVEDQATLFEPFARVSGSVHSAEGTGIGLTITKRLVELMGGVIGFESEYGKGTTFWVVLPGAPESNEARTEADWTSPPAITGRLKDLKILYVEDIPINLELMRQLIRRITGSDLLCATNARDGIDMAKTQKPDLILMDISLPGMDGFEALDVLKAGDDTAHIPVMAVTAHATREQVERAQETAFENYLIKPVIINQLIAALNDVVSGVSDSE